MNLFDRLVKTPYEKFLVACLVARQDADLDRIAALYKECQPRKL